MTYRDDLRLEEKFADKIKQILGRHFFVQDKFADQKEATDFMILTASAIRVGVRIRTFQYMHQFKNREEFTIRWSRPSGVDTEYQKIQKGLVSHNFYAFCDKQEKSLLQYLIGDLSFLRFPQYQRPAEIRQNNPPDSELAVYRISQLPGEFICKWWDSDGHGKPHGLTAREIFE